MPKKFATAEALAAEATARAAADTSLQTGKAAADLSNEAAQAALTASANRALFSLIGEPVRVMANPPLVTRSAGGASSGIASSVLYGPAYPQFRYSAHDMTFPPYATGFWGPAGSEPFSVTFATTARDLEILHYGEQRGAIQYWVNGELVSDRVFQTRVFGSKNADGLTYLHRLRFGERSDVAEPTWLAEYLRSTQDGDLIQWTAIAPTEGGYTPGSFMVNESAWSGASTSLSTTPPTGWSLLGSAQCQRVASDSGETNVLRVVATAANDALRITGVVSSPTTVALKMRVRTVGSGNWTLRLQGGAINIFVTIAGADFPAWHDIYIPIGTSSVGADGLGFVASGAGELWVDNVQLFEWSNGMAATDWAASTKYYVGDIVEPTTANGFLYRVDAIGTGEIIEVRCDMGRYDLFGGVRLPPNDALLPGTPVRRRVIGVLGDSITREGNAKGGDNRFGVVGTKAWCYRMADKLRLECWADGQAGTGYVATGATAKCRDRLPAMIARNPDAYCLAFGLNDSSFSPWTLPDVESEFLLCIALIRASAPTAPIFIVGPWNHEISSTVPTNGMLQLNDMLRENCAELGVYFLDDIEDGTLTGDYTVAASGNANQLYDADDVHGNALWHVMKGDWAARKARALASGATDRTEWVTLYSSGSWSGASGSTQPTGWTKVGTPTFTVADHDGQTNALEIVADTLNEGMSRTMLPAGAWGYVWRRVRVTFLVKVSSGEVVCNSAGTAVPAGGGHCIVSARWRPVGGEWSDIPGMTRGRTSSLNWTPFLTPANVGVWTEVDIIANAAQDSVQFYSRSGASTWRVDELSVAIENRD